HRRPPPAAPATPPQPRRRARPPPTPADTRTPRSSACASRGSRRAAAHPRPPWLSARLSPGGSTRTPTRPRSGRSARPRSARDADRHTRSPRSVRVELLGKKHGGRFQDLVRAAQVMHLATQLADLLALLAGQQIGALAAVGLRLAHTLAQRLRVDAQIRSDVRDRPLGLEHEPDAAL